MSKTFRIFLSSTFGDFQAEREALKRDVWPVLESRCRSHGAAFEVVDLRWGVSEADGLSHDTLRICLDEVAACRLLSPRPNFVMLIGDRYGWRPLPAEIPVSEFETLLATLATVDDRKLMQDWYRRDDNAIPPHYRLLPRDEKHRDYAAWSQVESRLLQILRAAATAAVMSKERRERYFLSATHLEIIKGTFSVPDAPEHVFSFFRNIEGLDAAGESAKRFTDLLRNGKPDPEAQALRGELRQEIRKKLPTDHCFDYDCKWNGKEKKPLTTKHIKKLCADVQQALLAQIDHELQDTGGDALQQEIDRHTQFAKDHVQGFIGREAELAQLMDWADAALSPPPTAENDDVEDYEDDAENESDDGSDSQPGSPPVIVHAPGGSGKSSFMAKGIDELKKRHPEAVIISRFVGTTPDSIELISLLRGLLVELAREYGQPEDLPEGGLKELIEALPERLAWATPEKPLLLVLDALDQFAPNLETREHRWLPVEMPHCAALMLSVLDGRVQEAACRRFPEATRIALPAFTREEGGTLLVALLLAGEAVAPERKRCLTQEQRKAVLDAFAHDGRPLYLVLAAGIARQWHSWQAPEHLPNTIEILIVEIVRRLHDTHGKAIADRALDYLCASRYGVSDEEMRDLLWRDPDAKAEFDTRKNPDQPDVDSLPPVIWSRIHSELAPWLAAQNIGGSLLHRFFHRILGEEIAKVSLKDDAAVVHQRLADYFGSQPLRLEGQEGRSSRQPNLRRLMELPWQLIKAGLLPEAEALLTDFDFAMAKCEAGLVEDLLEDYLRLKDALEKQPQSAKLKEWNSFMRRNAHYLRRGTALWPAHKILLQVAIEEADDSVITQAAEAWLSQRHCDWVWVRNKTRPATKGHNPLLAVMEGHTEFVSGALLLPDGRILSWGDCTLRLWNGQSGSALAVLEGHTSWITGALVLTDGRILSWGGRTLRLWDGLTGAGLAVMEGHTRKIKDALVLPDGRIRSWGYGTLGLWDAQTGAALAITKVYDYHVHNDEDLVLPDGRILSWNRRTLRLWDGQTGAALAVMKGHKGHVSGVLALPDGRILSWCGASRSPDHTLRLWDGQTGAALAVMKAHKGLVYGALDLPDGRILSWSDDKTLRLWDGQTGAALAVMAGHTESVGGALVMPDSRILSWSTDKTLRLWDGQTGAALAVMAGHTEYVGGAMVMPDSRILSWSAYVPGSTGATLRLWDGQSGAALAVLEGHTQVVVGVKVTPDGQILTWSRDGTLRLWDGQTGIPRSVMAGHTDRIRDVLLLPDNRILSWSFDIDHTLRLWDGQTDAVLTPLEGHTERITDTLALPGGRILSWSYLMRAGDTTLRLWDGQTGVALAAMKGHTNKVNGAMALPDSQILSWSRDGTLRLWDGQTGAALAVIEEGTDGARLLPDGRILSWGNNGLRLWDRQTGAALSVPGVVRDTLLLPDGRILSWGDRTLRLWDRQSGSALAVLEGHTAEVIGALVLPDGRILSWSDDHTLRLWGGQTGVALAVMKGYKGNVKGVLALPDGRILSWAGRTLRLWDGQTGAALAAMKGHKANVDGVLVLADGRILSWCGTSRSPDHTLRLWDGQTGAALAVMKGHKGYVNGVLDLPDGRILSWSDDHTLRLWDGQTGVCLSTYRPFWTEEWSDEDLDFPLPDGLSTDFDSMHRSGNVWVQIDRGNVGPCNIKWADRTAGWQAQWVGDATEFRELIADSWIVSSGRHLHFLQLMRGNAPLET